MKTTQFSLAAALLVVGSSFAGAYEKMVVAPQPVCGPWYVAAYGGGSFFDQVDYRDSTSLGAGAIQANLHADNGWIVGGAVGLRTANAWRFELDLNHTQSPMDSFVVFNSAGTVLGTGNARGEIERTSLLVNAVKEFDALQFLGLTPYLGAGIGLTAVEADVIGAGGFLEADELVLGYQFLGGLVCDLTDCLQAYVEFRLAGQGNLEDTTTVGSYGDADLGWAQHVILGVRWFF